MTGKKERRVPWTTEHQARALRRTLAISWLGGLTACGKEEKVYFRRVGPKNIILIVVTNPLKIEKSLIR